MEREFCNFMHWGNSKFLHVIVLSISSEFCPELFSEKYPKNFEKICGISLPILRRAQSTVLTNQVKNKTNLIKSMLRTEQKITLGAGLHVRGGPTHIYTLVHKNNYAEWLFCYLFEIETSDTTHSPFKYLMGGGVQVHV